MRSRHRAREAALQALFQCDSLNDWSDECLESFYLHWLESSGEDFPNSCAAEQETASKNTLQYVEFSKLLAHGVIDNRRYLDRKISSVSASWPLSRMPLVDRNILRMGAFELAFIGDVPVNVSINEAIELARYFGGNDSPAFVNAVLDRFVKELRRIPAALSEILSAANLKAA